MLCTLICYLLLKGWNYSFLFSKIVLLGATVWITNAGFTIFASSAALRFQSFPIIVTAVMACLLIDWMVKALDTMKMENNKENVYSECKKEKIGTEIIA